MKTSLRHFLRFAFVTALTCGPALLAQTSAYDGLRPADGYNATVGGEGSLSAQLLSGPQGWEKSWSLPKAVRSPLYLFRDDAGLTYPAITYPGGGGCVITPTDSAVHEIGRKLTHPIPMKGNAAIYASFLMSVSKKSPQGMAYALFTGIGGLGAGISDGSLMVMTRRDAEQTDEAVPPTKEWVPLTNQSFEADTTYYFVIKISDGSDAWAGGDEMEVWINPKDVSTPAAASVKSLHYNTDLPGNIAPPSGAITQLLLHAENLQGTTVKFDEFRVGPTWESVTAPPLP